MKTTPTIQSTDTRATEISREKAVDHLRRERADGKVFKLPSGYLLSSQLRFLVIPRAPRCRRLNNPVSIRLAVRTTRKYNVGWRDLDNSHDLGEATITHAKASRTYDGDLGFSQLVIVSISAEAARYRPRNIIRALEDAFHTGCRCEHDCCGHMQVQASKIRRLRDNRYAVIRSGYANV